MERPADRRTTFPAFARGLVLALAVGALAAGCTASDIERALYAGGKIAYDSFKASGQQRR